MVKLLGKRTWITMEGPFYIEIFTKTLLVCVFSVTCLDHAVLKFRFESPNIFFEHVIYLFFGMDSIPEEKVVNFIIIFANVFPSPYVIYRIRPDTHPPYIFTMLNIKVLRKHSPRSIKLIYKPDLLCCLKFTHPLVHELTR